ncbi:hypothetical protein BDZ89DRAFT_1168231 [Hymenopellis radicata]|nr:hypothetical protein BDZ89DRAFT_1168231 [Hymenopellis radicata]
MIGLHLCIFQDIFARRPVLDAPVAEQPQSGASGSNKRSADHVSRESSPKRGRQTEGISQRARRPSTTSRASRIQDRINQPKESRQGTKHRRRICASARMAILRHILCLQCIFSTDTIILQLLRSSCAGPSGSKMYKAATCLPIILTSKLGRGATGKAYTAVLGPGYDNLPVVAWSSSLQTRRTVSSLFVMNMTCTVTFSPSGVHGIPYVFGYYQDSTRGLGVLVLHDVGNPLGRRNG